MCKIDLNKKYRTADGRKVELLSVNGKYNPIRSIVGQVQASDGLWTILSWTPEGEAFMGIDNLVEVEPWEGLEVDDIIMVVIARGDTPAPRHYAGSGKFFGNGRSSHTYTCEVRLNDTYFWEVV